MVGVTGKEQACQLPETSESRVIGKRESESVPETGESSESGKRECVGSRNKPKQGYRKGESESVP